MNNELLLSLDDFADFGVVDGGMHIALHHGSPLIVLNVPFPSLRRHLAVFAEALLSEVSQRQIVSVGHEVLYLSMLHFLFEFVHEAGSKALYLFSRSDSEEGYLCEPFLLEFSEANTTHNLCVIP